MIGLLLNLLLETSMQDYSLWIVLFVITIVMIWLLFLQRHQRKQLKGELTELAKIQKRNVEYEFVIKAMRVSVWHVDAKTHTISYDVEIWKGTNRSIAYKYAILIITSLSSFICLSGRNQFFTPYFLLNCPQAASISLPIPLLIVTFIPDFSSIFLNSSICSLLLLTNSLS